MSETAFIFARGGSKGLPGKNVRPLAGRPLIGWSVQQALAVDGIDRVIVSTDDLEIARISREQGAEVPFMRPAELASDTASEWDAWRHGLSNLAETEGRMPTTFISVPTTSPMRLPEDIAACLDTYRRTDAEIVVAVTAAHRNPWFNMVRTRDDGSIVPVNNVDGLTRRQDAPMVHDLTTIAYVGDPSVIMTKTALFQARVKSIEVPVERALDIDTAFDFELAEILMRKRLGEQG